MGALRLSSLIDDAALGDSFPHGRAVLRSTKRSFSVPGQPFSPFDSFSTGVIAHA
jgi:hypothetical protein